MLCKPKIRIHPEPNSISISSQGDLSQPEELNGMRFESINSEEGRQKIKERLEFLLTNVKDLFDEMYVSHIAEYLAKAQSITERNEIVARYTNKIYSLKKELSEIEDILENVYQSMKIYDLASDEECGMSKFIKDCILFVRDVETECTSFFEETSFAHMARMIMLFKLDRRFLAQIHLDYKQWALHNLYQLGLLTKQNATLDEHNLSTNSGRSPNKGTDITEGEYFGNAEYPSRFNLSPSKQKNSFSMKNNTGLDALNSRNSFANSSCLP